VAIVLRLGDEPLEVPELAGHAPTEIQADELLERDQPAGEQVLLVVDDRAAAR
jgi:hypothetical protein